jgi:hypothetical protein
MQLLLATLVLSIIRSAPHNTPPIHKLSQQQNKTQVLLLVLVNYSVAAIGHDSYAGFNTHYDAGWK